MRLPRLIATAVTLAALAIFAGAASGGSTPVKPLTIIIGDFSYTPNIVRADVGQTVRFINRGKIAHTVADTTPSGRILSRLIKPRPLNRGQTQTVRFSKAGTIYYVCTFHPSLMKGRILVTASR